MKSILNYTHLTVTDLSWFPTISKNSFWYNLYIVNLCRNLITFFRLWMVRFGKWYVFKCFSPYIKPLMVSWSPFFILHRLRSFRTCSVGWQSFIVRSISSFPTFLPGKLAISVFRCSKVRFGWPICLKTLFSQRSISIQSKKNNRR